MANNKPNTTGLTFFNLFFNPFKKRNTEIIKETVIIKTDRFAPLDPSKNIVDIIMK